MPSFCLECFQRKIFKSYFSSGTRRDVKEKTQGPWAPSERSLINNPITPLPGCFQCKFDFQLFAQIFRFGACPVINSHISKLIHARRIKGCIMFVPDNITYILRLVVRRPSD